MAAIALGFSSAVVWGLADFLGGLKSRQLALLTVMLWSQAAALVALAVVVAVRGEAPEGASIVPWSMLAAVAGTVGLAAFYRGLAVGAMGVVSPVSASAAAIPVAAGVVSGERPSAIQFAGVAIAVVGVAVASYEPRGRSRAAPAAGVGLALVAALGFGTFFVAIDEAADRDLLWALTISRATSTGILLAAALAMRPRLAVGRGDLRALVAIGLLDVSANALFAAGTQLGLVSIVSVLGSLYPVMTIVLARLVLGERLRAAQRTGAVGALAGVALISAG
ncbi:MAG TPA: DMT family transporter [Thermoleophilaceae bacterium]|jgi:drug/metabolite transporter (DMT)-like permease